MQVKIFFKNQGVKHAYTLYLLDYYSCNYIPISSRTIMSNRIPTQKTSLTYSGLFGIIYR